MKARSERPDADARIRVAAGAADLRAARQLFAEYAASIPEAIDAVAFAAELQRFPADYSPPDGLILIAAADLDVVGCVGLRTLSPTIAELKRLYVRSTHRGRGLGRALVRAALDRARRSGHDRVRLDTAPSLVAALTLYASLGFRPIAPYGADPIAGAVFLEIGLS